MVTANSKSKSGRTGSLLSIAPAEPASRREERLVAGRQAEVEPSEPSSSETLTAFERLRRSIADRLPGAGSGGQEEPARPAAPPEQNSDRECDQDESRPVEPASHAIAAQRPAKAEIRASTAEPSDARGNQRPDNAYWQPLIDPMKVVGGVFRSKTIIVLSTVAGAVLAALIALSTPKEYVAVAEVLVDPRDVRIMETDPNAGLPSDALLAIVENQARVMSSLTVIGRVVDTLKLAADPEFNGQAAGMGPRAILDLVRGLLAGADDEDAQPGRLRALAIDNLYRAVDIGRDGRTFVVSVVARTESPDKSALIANAITNAYLESYAGIRQESAGRASGELTDRLDELRREVESAERAVETFKSENDLIDAQGRLISDDEIVKLNDQLSTARARTLELNARAASSRQVSIDGLLSGDLPEQINSPVLTELRTRYAALSQDVQRLAVRLGPRHPERIAADAQLAGARRQIEQELQLIVSSIQVDLRRAVQLEQELASRLAQLKARQANISDELVTLRELERDAASRRTIYETFLTRARETGQQRGINTANVSVISQASPPLEPSGMSRTMMTLIGAFLGFAAGIGIGGARGAWASFRENAERNRSVPASFNESSTPNESNETPAASTEASGSEQGSKDPTMYPRHVFPPAMEYAPYGHPSQPHGIPQDRHPYRAAPVHAPAQAPWPAHPAAGDPYAAAMYWGHQPHPGAHPYWAPAGPAQPPAQPADMEPGRGGSHDASEEMSAAIEEIRESIREFREELRQLAESRGRRRFL